MQLKSERKRCPVCKAPVSDDKVVPLYGRGSEADAARAESDEGIPERPQGHRLLVAQVDQPQQGDAGNGGFLPQLFGVQFSQAFSLLYSSLSPVNNVLSASDRDSVFSDPASPEQQQQAFLSRLLLMLGSFVIMCLLLF